MKKIILGSLLLIIYSIFGGITWGEHKWLLFATLISNFILSYFVFSRKKQTETIINLGLLINFPFIILLAATCIYYRDFSRGLLYILFLPLSSYLAYLYCIKKNILIPISSTALFFFIGFYVFPNFFSFYKNFNASKNINFPKVTLVTKDSIPVNLNKDKIIVLDFWSTTCGICYKKFPDLEKAYLKYKKNKKIEIYSVHVPVKSDRFSETTKILDSLGYTFPKLYSKSSKEIKNKLNIYSFPHLLIIKNGRIRYDGMLETNKNVYIFNLNSELQKLLNED